LTLVQLSLFQGYDYFISVATFDRFSFENLLKLTKENMKSRALNPMQPNDCDTEQSIVDEATHLHDHLLQTETPISTQ